VNSIRRRLIRSFVLIILAALTISGGLGFLTASHEIDELFDAQLVEEARVLAGVLSLPEQAIDWRVLQQALAHQEQTGDSREYDASYDKKVAVQVWSADGALLFRSASAPEHALAPLRAGFHVQPTERYRWHIYTVYIPDNRLWLLVGERSDVRRELSLSVAASLLIGFLASLGLALVLLRKRLTRDLSPLSRLRDAIGERALDQLHGIHLTDEPEEIRPVTEAINLLFDRVSQGVERERAFIADAAHELRTPLSIIRLHAQNALMHDDPERKNQSLHKVIQGVDRNTRVVHQLLMMARLDAPDSVLAQEPVALERVLAVLAQEFRPVLEARRITLRKMMDPELPACRGNADLLGALVRNLLENACNHVPDQGEINLGLNREGNCLVLTVSDSGPGVDPAMLDLIARRHVRAGPRDARGTGLGLEIVSRIVRLHQGEITFSNRAEGGLCVRVLLPVAPGSA